MGTRRQIQRWISGTEEICHCCSVDAEAIFQAVEKGARTFEKVQRVTSAGTACATCHDTVEECIDQAMVLRRDHRLGQYHLPFASATGGMNRARR